MRFSLAALALGGAAILGTVGGCERFEKKPPAPPPPPPEVMTLEIAPRNVELPSEWLGTLDGTVNAQIRAKVQGYLLRQVYADGSLVKKGEVLFEIDPRPFVAALDQAKGQLAQAEGQLGQAQAALGKADIDVERYTPLAATKAISQQELDDAVQAQLAARAGVDAAKANIAAAKAKVEDAQLNVDFTKITAPIDGIASIATTQVGDLVGPGSGVLTTISTVDPIRVYFPVSEQDFLKAAKRLGSSFANGAPKDTLQLLLSDGNLYEKRGSVIAANRQVDSKTGTVMIAGEFPNSENLLRPGQYARVRAITQRLENAIVVPQRALTEVQGAFQVYVVDSDDKIAVREVELGPQVNASDRIIAKGLEEGDEIVVEGQLKVRPGMKAVAKPWNPAPAKKTKKKAGEPSAAPEKTATDKEEAGSSGN